MADLLAIDWGHEQLCGVDAGAGKGNARAEKCFVLTWPDEMNPVEQPDEAGAWLKAQLEEQGISTKQVVVTLPRESTIVRHLELPEVPDDELPDLVRFQATTKSSLPLDQLLLDYLPLPQRVGYEGRDVLLATVPKKLSTTIQQVLGAAGMELTALGITPIAIGELVHHASTSKDDETVLMLARHGQRVEISVMRGKHLHFSHSAQLHGDSETRNLQTILSEVSRSLVALQKVFGSTEISHAWVVGREEDNQSLVDALKERLSSEVSVIDPLSTTGVTSSASDVPGDRSLYAGPIGMILSRTDNLVDAVDFLNPRKKAVKRDTRKVNAAISAAAIVVLCIIGYSFRSSKIGDLDAEIGGLQERDAELKELLELESSKEALTTSEEYNDWEATRVRWRNPVTEIVTSIPSTDDLLFSEMRLESKSGEFPGIVSGTVHAKARYHVESLQRELSDAGFRVKPNQITYDADDGEFPYRFRLDVDFSPTAVAKAAEAEESKDAETDSSAPRTRQRVGDRAAVAGEERS